MAEARQQISERKQWIPEYYWEIELCLPPFFTREEEKEDRFSWSWTSPYSEFKVHIRPDAKHDSITIYVRDTRCDKTIQRWTSRVQMTGAWNQRLRRAAGESYILAQRRPRCPKCRADMEVRERREDSAQFFGCTYYPSCKGLTNIIDHDIERKRAVSRRDAHAGGGGSVLKGQPASAASSR